MYSNNTPLILPEPANSHLFPNPFIFNIKRVRRVLSYGIAVFFAWAGLFWFKTARKNSSYVL